MIKEMYNKAIELLESDIATGTQKKIEYKGFEFIKVELNQGGDIGTQGGNDYVKIMHKPSQFSFTIHKNDPDDLRRIEFVYKVTLTANGHRYLIPFAKKTKTSLQKLQREFKISSELETRYNNLDIHNLDEVICFLEDLQDA